MDLQLEQIRDQQKASWNNFSPGWKKWDDLTMDFLKPMGDEIIRLLKIRDNDRVLDVAAGTGEPGLTIASMLTSGRVISTDLAEGMLAVAQENAVRRNLTNFDTQVCDVCELPFEDNTFDAVSCRFGFMFFPDMRLAAQEMVRVLKPGGRLATSVWNGPDKNFWVTATMSVINKHMQLPSPPAGAPGMFRCAQPGLIADLFADAGLSNLVETEVNSKLNVGSFEVYWRFMNDVVAPVVGALSKADDAQKAQIQADVFDLIQQKYPDGNVRIDASARVIYGEKA